MNNRELPFNFSDSLRFISHCPVCNTKHNVLKAKILEEKGDIRLVHIKCEKCKSSVVAVILSNPLGVSSVGLITDLDSEEVLKFREGSDISPDDVLELHEFLAKRKDFIKDLIY